MNLKNILLATLLTGIGLLSGCANRLPTAFISEINSLAHADAATKKHYILLSGVKGIKVSDLQFQEFSAYVENVLAEKEFIKSSTFQDADIAILLVYGIGDPQTYQSAYTTNTNYGSASSSSRTHVETTTTCTRSLSLDAYDLSAYNNRNFNKEELIQLWKTTAISTGSSCDLRLVVPYMVIAMKSYIGENTKQKIEARVFVNDPVVQSLLESTN